MLGRVQRLEKARAPVLSPIARAYGSFDAFAAESEALIDEGKLDSVDFTVVLYCLRRWEVDGTWGGQPRETSSVR